MIHAVPNNIYLYRSEEIETAVESDKKAQLSLTNPCDACQKVCTVYVIAVGL